MFTSMNQLAAKYPLLNNKSSMLKKSVLITFRWAMVLDNTKERCDECGSLCLAIQFLHGPLASGTSKGTS